MCKEKDEDIVHFLIDCKKLEKLRNYDLINKDIPNSEDRMRSLLFKNNRFQEIGNMIKNYGSKEDISWIVIRKRMKIPQIGTH